MATEVLMVGVRLLLKASYWNAFLSEFLLQLVQFSLILIIQTYFQKTLKEFFLSWYAIRRYEEVVIFTCGLMIDPRPLIEHAYEMWIEKWLNMMRFDQVDHQAEGRMEAEGKDIREFESCLIP